MKKSVRPVLLLALFLSLFSSFQPLLAEAAEYSFGMVPQFEQRKLYAIWKPIVDELEKRTGLKFRLITTLQVDDFEQQFMKGSFDFVYMNPYFIARTSDTLGYIPIVRDKTNLRGILVVRKDGQINKPEDLKGRTVAFPTPNAPSGCMMMKADLKNKFDVTVSPAYVKTASNAYLHLLKGLADGAGVPDKTFEMQEPAVRDSLRILYETQPIPPHPISAHPRVNKADREKVRRALLDMAQSPAGRELLSKVPMKEAVAATLEEYTALRKLGLDAYWDPSWKGD